MRAGQRCWERVAARAWTSGGSPMMTRWGGGAKPCPVRPAVGGHASNIRWWWMRGRRGGRDVGGGTVDARIDASRRVRLSQCGPSGSPCAQARLLPWPCGGPRRMSRSHGSCRRRGRGGDGHSRRGSPPTRPAKRSPLPDGRIPRTNNLSERELGPEGVGATVTLKSLDCLDNFAYREIWTFLSSKRDSASERGRHRTKGCPRQCPNPTPSPHQVSSP